MGNTFYNRTTILSKVFIITFFVSINLFGQKNVRIGFLDLDLVLNNNNDYITANQELESKINIWRTEIENRQKEILGKKESLKIESALLTNELIEERIEDIKYDEDLLNTYIDKRFGVEGDWIKEKVLLSQPAQDEILIAIREIAADRKLDYVFDSSADILVLHSEKKYDIIVITGAVESRLEKLEQILNQKGKMFIVIGNYPVMNVNIIEKVSENKLICDQSFETVIDHLINNNKKNILNF